MDVANPIYDVVFTYLMQDQRVARLLIGRITGLAVQSLTVSPQETAVRNSPDNRSRRSPRKLLRSRPGPRRLPRARTLRLTRR